MSELIAVGFDDLAGASKALDELYRQQDRDLIDLEGASILTLDADGKPSVWQPESLADKGFLAGGISGGIVGSLVGALVLSPVLSGVLGTAAGSLVGGTAGALREIGIEDDFINELSETVKDYKSVLFIQASTDRPYTMLSEMKPTDGTVLKTSLNYFDEENLQKALEGRLEPLLV